MAGVTPMIRVRALQPARRRAGFSFGQTDADIAPAEITRDQFDQLLADPQLVTGVANAADEGFVVLTGMSEDQIDELLEALDIVFPDEIVSEPLDVGSEDTGAPAAGGEAAGDLAAGAAGDQSTSAAPASAETSADAAAVTPAAKAPAPKPSGRKPKN